MWSISRSTIGSGLQAINHFINILWLWLYFTATRFNRLIEKVIDLRSYLIFLYIFVASPIPTLEIASPMPKRRLSNQFSFNFADEDVALLTFLILSQANESPCDVVRVTQD